MSGNRSSFKTMYNTIRVAFAFFLLLLLILIWRQVCQVAPPGPGLWVIIGGGTLATGFFSIRLWRNKGKPLTPAQEFRYALGIGWLITAGFLLTLLIRVLSYFDLIEGFRKPTGQSFVTNLLFLAGCVANLVRLYRRKAPPEDTP